MHKIKFITFVILASFKLLKTMNSELTCNELGLAFESETLTKELELAIRKNDYEKVKTLITEGVGINTPYILNGSTFHMTPLIQAVMKKRGTAIIILLLSSRAKIDETDDHGWTPLAYAATANYLKNVKILVEMKADINKRGSITKKTALELARLNINNKETIKFLEEKTIERKKAVKAELEKYMVPVLADIALEHEI